MLSHITHWLLLPSCTNDLPTDDKTNNDTQADVEPIFTTGTIRFVALGDAGEGNQAQYDVANAIKTVCEEKGCDFALYLGDNFYDSGVESVDDPQFINKFEDPYAELNFPFYAVLGNHDYGFGSVWERPEPQVAYSDISDKWIMPSRYHSNIIDHALFVGIDTNAIMWNNHWGGMEDQANWAEEVIYDSGTLWKFAYGHHPYISNGEHGVAGHYDGLEEVPIASGTDIKTFVEDQFCGKIDIYFSGHDHDMQWLEPTCGVEFIVSGAGAKQRSYRGWDIATKFEIYNENGFLWVEIVDSQLNAAFYDKNAELLYQDSIVK
jgi:tartrate-resistant acid phosphatase type 5